MCVCVCQRDRGETGRQIDRQKKIKETEITRKYRELSSQSSGLGELPESMFGYKMKMEGL